MKIVTLLYLEYVGLQLRLLPEGLPARLADLLRHGRLLVHPPDVLVDGALDRTERCYVILYVLCLFSTVTLG